MTATPLPYATRAHRSKNPAASHVRQGGRHARYDTPPTAHTHVPRADDPARDENMQPETQTREGQTREHPPALPEHPGLDTDAWHAAAERWLDAQAHLHQVARAWSATKRIPKGAPPARRLTYAKRVMDRLLEAAKEHMTEAHLALDEQGGW